MSFSIFSKPDATAAPMGANITKDGPIANLNKFKTAIQNNGRKVREEFLKYQKMTEFNKQLATSYSQNVEAMVDISRVFGYYIELFNVLKAELDKNAEFLGKSAIKAEDVAYIEGLTQTKMEALNKKFLEETAKMKKLYEGTEYQSELARIVTAEKNILNVNKSASDTYNELVKINQESARLNAGVPASGGSSKKYNTKTRKYVKKSKK
jgi:hypothetical protein